MFAFAWAFAARTRFLLRRFMPTNILLDAINTRGGLKWGALAMLLAVPYALVAVLCVGLVERGAPGWASLLAILFIWNALKFLIAGPAALLRLMRVRGIEARIRLNATTDVENERRAAHLAEETALIP